MSQEDYTYKNIFLGGDHMKFTSINTLGQGSYGRVELGTVQDTITGNIYGPLVRKIIVNYKSAKREIAVLTRIRDSGYCDKYFLCLVGLHIGMILSPVI